MRISRRNFIKSLTASTAGVAAAGLLASCNSAASSAPAASSAAASEAPAESTAADASSVQPAQLLETDVAVIGLGASGMLAALGAADKGANVIAIDTAPNFEATTNTHTTGSWLVESSEQLKYDHYLTQEQAFGRIMEGTNYQCNGKVVRNMLKVSGRAADIMIQGGVQFMYAFANSDENTDWLSRGGHVYLEEGEPRANNFREMCAARSTLTTMFSTRATQLLTGSDGKVTGLLAEGSDDVIQINAKAVICCGGGFLANADMVKEHFAGAQIVNQGFATVDGSTIQMCQSVGAQLGKNFSVSCNEMGAANFKAKPQYSWAPGRNTSACFYLPLFGNILMDKNGDRFINEQRMAEQTMYTGEPLIRDSVYYTVIDSANLERLKTTPVYDFLSDGSKANMGMALLAGFQGVTLTEMDKDIEQAISEGWAAKADTLEELAEKFGLPHMVDTVAAYNEACQSGHDDDFFTPADYLTPVTEGPYYIFEYNPGAWCTIGGIKTDGNCRALDADNHVIGGLYVAGCAADLWSVPYYQGGSCNGFSLASGLLAGETAADDLV